MTGTATQEFADRLRMLKSHEGWSIHFMAARARLPLRTMEDLLAWRNTEEPGLETLVKIATGLDISLNWLVLGKGPIALPEKRP